MGYLGRRIGKSQDTATDAANSSDGGGILDLFSNGYFQRQGNIYKKKLMNGILKIEIKNLILRNTKNF